MKKTLCCTFLTLILVSLSLADVSMPPIFSDNMVIQAGKPVYFYGWAEPGEKVTVKGSWHWLWGQTTRADEDGSWKVAVKAPKSGGPYTIRVMGNNAIKINNILCGQVWLCSGQSNMQWNVKNTQNAEVEIAAANYPKIRLFKMPLKSLQIPQVHFEGEWVECSPETIPDFTAVGYFFGRELYQNLDTPVGLIQSAWGGTPAEAWTPRPVLEAEPDYQPILERYTAALEVHPQAMQEYELKRKEWLEHVQEARQKNEQPDRSRMPREPMGPEHKDAPSGLFNAMINPLIPYTIKGAIWYQGESNAGRAVQYRKLFPDMIQSWRDRWGEGDFPFYYVQIAPHKAMNPWIRDAQEYALELPNTGQAVITDIGDFENIHPRNKQDVGKRLALQALAKTYGRKVVASGPTYKSMDVEKTVVAYDAGANSQKTRDKIRITFDNVGSGLVSIDGKPLTEFEVAGADQVFYPAEAKIDGNTVVVRSEEVPNPVAVRFGWSYTPNPNLFNKEGLPAAPFRTDDWPAPEDLRSN